VHAKRLARRAGRKPLIARKAAVSPRRVDDSLESRGGGLATPPPHAHRASFEESLSVGDRRVGACVEQFAGRRGFPPMMAARVDPPDAPLAIVVSQEEPTGASIARALRAHGYRTFAIDSACSDTDSLEGLRPAIIVLDIRGETASATRTLAALSDRPSSPPVVLFSARDDATLVAARFGLLAVSQGAPERELLATIERSRRDQRRPTRR
jgi:hypothetical protein